jgi:hypothetical protein
LREFHRALQDIEIPASRFGNKDVPLFTRHGKGEEGEESKESEESEKSEKRNVTQVPDTPKNCKYDRE